MEPLRIDPERCTLCGSCTSVCVRSILAVEDGALAVTEPSRCILCGHCKAVCPEDAVRVPALDETEFEDAPGPGTLPTPVQLMGLMRSRRSVRIFRPEAVSRETIERVIEAGRFAPTGGNLQALRHAVAATPERMASIRDLTVAALSEEAGKMEAALAKKEATGVPLSPGGELQKTYADLFREMADRNAEGIDRLFYDAPALVVTHANTERVGSAAVDAGLSAMQMVLMAEALGLGTCFIGLVPLAERKSPDLRRALRIPESHDTLVAFALGYPGVSYLRLVSRRPARVRWLD